MTTPPTVRIGTRTSRLALCQTRSVAAHLGRQHPGMRTEIVPISTAGDRDGTTPLPRLGGNGVFTEELEQALRAQSIDLAVHSLKDLPVDPAEDLEFMVVGPRADARDVLVAQDRVTLLTLPGQATVGTCSTRRAAQLLAARPDLQLASLRGNVDTRVAQARAGRFDAIVVAAAGVDRLGLTTVVRERIPLAVLLPAPGQGALAVQFRNADAASRDLLRPLADAGITAATEAERAFLAALGGGCDAPIAAYGLVHGADLALAGLVASPDGRAVVRVSLAGPVGRPAALGARLADLALARGAAELA